MTVSINICVPKWKSVECFSACGLSQQSAKHHVLPWSKWLFKGLLRNVLTLIAGGQFSVVCHSSLGLLKGGTHYSAVHYPLMNVCLVETKIQCLPLEPRAGRVKFSKIKTMCPSATQGGLLLHIIHVWGSPGNSGNSVRLYFFWAPKSLQMVIAAMKLKDACSLEGKLWST